MFSSELVVLGFAIAGAGAVAGLSAGMFGIGGGMILVPALLAVFKEMNASPDVAMLLAIGTSLATIMPTSLVSLRAHFSHGSVDKALLRVWAIPVMTGSLIGSYSASLLNGETLKICFGLLAGGIALYMAFGPKEPKPNPHALGRWRQRLIAFTIGGASSLVGIGGGSLAVPTMVFNGVPMKRAVGTASAMGALVALPATIVLLLTPTSGGPVPVGSLGHINWLAFGLLLPATMMTAPQGARLAHRLHPHLLKRCFAGFLVLVAVKMIADAL